MTVFRQQRREGRPQLCRGRSACSWPGHAGSPAAPVRARAVSAGGLAVTRLRALCLNLCLVFSELRSGSLCLLLNLRNFYSEFLHCFSCLSVSFLLGLPCRDVKASDIIPQVPGAFSFLSSFFLFFFFRLDTFS